MKIKYTIEEELDPIEFTDVLIESGLGKRRPIEEFDIIYGMCTNADIIVTARDNEGTLIGVARSITDWHYCTYLSDLAVHKKYQHQGIGKKLIEETKKVVPEANLILLSAPAAVEYYPKIGMTAAPGFILKDSNALK